MSQKTSLSILSFLVCVAAPSMAQDTAILSGSVTDPTGAVIAGAQVTAVNVATNFESATETNSEGLYRVPALRPGMYRVTIAATGFKRFVQDNVELRIGATVPVNAILQIGAVAESVEVTGKPPLLETETSTTGTIVDGEFFARMPLFQRHSRGLSTSRQV